MTPSAREQLAAACLAIVQAHPELRQQHRRLTRLLRRLGARAARLRQLEAERVSA